jgi:hypothetical protein
VNTKTKDQRGLIMLEALVAMTLIVIAASGILWFLHRASRTAAVQRSQLQPPCERPECSSSQTVSECRCGAQTFVTFR